MIMFFRPVMLFAISLSVAFPASQPSEQEAKRSGKSKAAVSNQSDKLRSSATSLLYTLAQSGNEIDSVYERVLVLAEVGDALWSVDQDYARRILVRDFQEIDKLSSGSDTDRERAASQTRTLRRIVLSRIAKHDPILASELIHGLKTEPPTEDDKARQRYGAATPNGEALLGLAQNLLATDTRKAAALAMASLQDGLSQRLRLFLISLRAKDSGTADALADAALKQASSEHPGRLFDVLMLWDYAYQPPHFYLNGISWEREPSEQQYPRSPLLQRKVLQFAVSAVLENLQQLPNRLQLEQDRRLSEQQAGAIYSVVQQVLPSMQADWPEGAVDLQQALARVQRDLQTIGQKAPEPPPVNDRSETNDSMVQKLLDAASSASMGDARDALYLAAAFKLLQIERYEEAKEAAARIDNLDRRQMVLEPTNFKHAIELVEKGNLTEAQGIASQLKRPELRIDVLARIGNAFLAKRDEPNGLDALYSAQSLASKAEPAVEISAATLRVASAMIKQEAARATELIGLAIQIANKSKEDQSPWSLLSPASSDPLNFSWNNADGGGLQSVKTSYGRNGGLAALLSKLEFEQAVALAKDIKWKAISLAVQAAVCRAAIESTQDKVAVTRR